MSEIIGKLVPRDGGSAARAPYAGHSVEAMVALAPADGAAGIADDTHFVRADVTPVGAFTLTLPGDGPVRGTADFVVRAPGGARLALFETDQLERVEIPVDAAVAPDLTDAEQQPNPVTTTIALRVALHAEDGTSSVANRLILIWGGPRNADGATPPLSVIGAEPSDGTGRARIEVAAIAYDHVEVEVVGSIATAGRVTVPLDDLGAVRTDVVNVPVAFPPATEDAPADCDCAQPDVPRTPDHEDLIASGGVFAQDLNGADCVKLNIPNRTLEEYSFFSLVRSTDPLLWTARRKVFQPRPPLSKTALGMAAEIAFGASALDTRLKAGERGNTDGGNDGLATRSRVASGIRQDDLRLGSEAYRASGLIAARAWREEVDLDSARKAILDRASRLSEDVLRQALSDPDGFTPVALMTAERKSALEDVEAAAAAMTEVPGRPALTAANPIGWEFFPRYSQAATIAHGHLLEFRQQWKADGYSLGDLLYSLPLAPGQKRRMVVLDWDRQELGVRQESRSFEERFSATASRDRDISEIVNSTVTESIRGGSSANSWGAGGGFGLGIPIGAGFLGIGVAGGAGGASSTAWQNSARGLAASTAQNLSDRTQQAAAAVRSQRGTVVTSQRQGESVSVTSEVVANYNHCHAVTLEYFEVLKHYRVDQVLADARECLFVPLEMKPFDDFKALRWQDVLEGRLRDRTVTDGFDATYRIQTAYADADLPPARYADEIVTEIWGELGIELEFARPRDPQEGEDINAYINSAWNFWNSLFGAGSARQVFDSVIAGQKLADRIFADELAPRLARSFCDGLTLSLQLNDGTLIPLGADFTMVTRYRAGREHLVTFRVAGVPAVRRTDIRGLQIASNLQFAPNSRTLLRSANVSYRNAYQSFALVAPRRAADDIRPGDPAFLSARWLSRAEEFNPRENDRTLRDALIKHLNEHIEHYHQMIFWLMDPARRFMLLDGFIAPNSGGRSVASVTENLLINIVGNCLVLPVAPGYTLDPTVHRTDRNGKPISLLAVYQPTIPIPPRRISVPTRGVYAESIMGSCNSCERVEDSRFWRWEEEPIGEEPTAIGTTDTGTRRQAPPDTTPTAFPQPVVAVQSVPAAPDPTGFGAITALLGQQALFKDVSGLAGNQANALGSFKQALQTANNFGKLAAAGAKAVHAQRTSKQVMDKVGEARAKKQLSDDDAKKVIGKMFGVLNGDLGNKSTPLAEEQKLKDALSKVFAGKGDKSVKVKTDSGNTSQSAEVKLKDGDAAPPPAAEVEGAVDGEVPLVRQGDKSNGCWAAALTMLLSWTAGTTLSIEDALAQGGQLYVDKFNANTGLLPTEVEAFKTAFGLRDATLKPVEAKSLAKLLVERGPLWVIGDQDPGATFSIHARVVTAVSGTGKPPSTKIVFKDPASSEPGEDSLTNFIDQLDQLADGVASSFGAFSPQILSL